MYRWTFTLILAYSLLSSFGFSTASPEPFAFHWSPTWSPDGRFLAFGYKHYSETGVGILEIETGNFRTISLPQLSWDYSVVIWSPIRSQIIVGDTSSIDIWYQEMSPIWLIDTETLALQELMTSDTTSITAFAWSPDGTKLAFATLEEDSNAENIQSAVWILDMDTLSSEKVFNDSFIINTALAWSPDARFIAVGSSQFSFTVPRELVAQGMRIISLEYDTVTQFASGLLILGIKWLPQNNMVLLDAIEDENNFSDTFMLNLTDGSLINLSAKTNIRGDIWQWSTDGTFFVFAGVSYEPRTYDLWRYDTATEIATKILPDCDCWNPVLSPDNSYIAFVSTKDTGELSNNIWMINDEFSDDIWMINLDGTGLRNLTGQFWRP